MKVLNVNEVGSGFHVLAKTARSEAASMVLEPGESTGGPQNRHQGADQWLLVLSGSGQAVVNGQDVELAPAGLLLIEAGDRHEIRCTGDEPLVTVNFYGPPEY